ncbi:inner membrane protein YpjD [Psychromonas sp. B3M02]|uniref:cytochrome C assembly family protein n=1 Tax=unclassified Psychromonas TaxID=2614957 RepID=UPI000DEB1646|nr:cytochrome c biogenesis protein CcsA [Psychromonas sp. B3M02]RBW47057.1 inner membrane protein YpjD [Psychromonas sp. B3M02]
MDLLAIISIVFYVLSGVLASRQLFSCNPNPTFSMPMISLSSIALLTHAVWLYQHIFLVNGQNLPILNVLSLATFVIALLSFAMSKKVNTGVLLPVVYGFNAINFIVVMFLPSHYITHLENHPQLGIHIILAILAYAIMTIASLFALQLAYVDHRLKKHKTLLCKVNLPPLMTLEKSLFQLIFIGFILLTGTLLTGFIFIEDMFESENGHKALLTMIAWVVYAVLLWGRYKNGWRGRLVIYITIAGSSLLTLAYFGSRIVREIIL